MISPARRVFSVLLACAFAAPCAGGVTTFAPTFYGKPCGAEYLAEVLAWKSALPS